MTKQIKLGAPWPGILVLAMIHLHSFQTGANDGASNGGVPDATPDTSPPELRYAGGSPTMDQVRVWFSEPVDPATAQVVSNYALSGGLTVSAGAVVAAPADNTVVLTTSPQPEGVQLTLTVNNVKDLAGNVISPGSPSRL